MRYDLVRVYTPTFTRLHVFPAGLAASCMGGARPFFFLALRPYRKCLVTKLLPDLIHSIYVQRCNVQLKLKLEL